MKTFYYQPGEPPVLSPKEPMTERTKWDWNVG